MSPTNEQIIAEAERRWAESTMSSRSNKTAKDFIIEVMREGWTPPEPVDPDLLAFREWAASDCEAIGWKGGAPLHRLGHFDRSERAEAYLAGARMARAEKLSLLKWLTDQRSLELSWGADSEEDGAWRVHTVVGGVNDREWHLIATGETPLAALKNARAQLERPDQ